MKINVFMVIGKFGFQYAEVMRENMDLLKSQSSELEYFCINQDPYLDVPEGMKNVGVIQYYGPTTHGVGLNNIAAQIAAKKFPDAEYTVFTDVDILMMIPNWDEYLIKYINDDCKAIGCSGDMVSYYQDFPCVVFILFETRALRRAIKHGIDFRSEILDSGRCSYRGATDNERKFVKLNDDKVFKRDTGWRLPVVFGELGYKGIAFSQESPTLVQIPRCVEYHMKKKPVVCHLRKSHSRGDKAWDDWKQLHKIISERHK